MENPLELALSKQIKHKLVVPHEYSDELFEDVVKSKHTLNRHIEGKSKLELPTSQQLDLIDELDTLQKKLDKLEDYDHISADYMMNHYSEFLSSSDEPNSPLYIEYREKLEKLKSLKQIYINRESIVEKIEKIFKQVQPFNYRIDNLTYIGEKEEGQNPYLN